MKNVGNSSRGRSQGVPKIFRAPCIGALRRSVIFAIAQLSCLKRQTVPNIDYMLIEKLWATAGRQGRNQTSIQEEANLPSPIPHLLSPPLLLPLLSFPILPLPYPSFPSPPFPSLSLFPFPLPLPWLPPLPLEVGPLNPANGSGEHCELSQRGLGRSPSWSRIWCISALKSGSCWQQF